MSRPLFSASWYRVAELRPRLRSHARIHRRRFRGRASFVLEDPATGSATANFGGWWLATNQPLPCQLQISQGEYVARPSTLYLQVDSQRRILVSGDVIEIARGTLQL